MNTETIRWEGIDWAQTSTWTSKHRTMKCDGCGQEVNAVARFSAVDPLGATIEAKWCYDCQEHARATGEVA